MTIKGGYIKNIERKKVANATPTNSIAFLKTPTDFKEPDLKKSFFFYKILRKNGRLMCITLYEGINVEHCSFDKI